MQTSTSTRARTRLLETLIYGFHKIGALICIPALIILVGVDVFMRATFLISYAWAPEVASLLLLTTFAACLPACTKDDGHVRMEIFYDNMGRGQRKVADAISAICGLSFASALTWRSIVTAIEAYEFGEGAEYINISFWPFSVLLAITGALLCLIFLANLGKSLGLSASSVNNS